MSSDTPNSSDRGTRASDVTVRAEVVHVPENDDAAVTLRLSDSAIKALGAQLHAGHAIDPAEALGDIDAWHVRTEGGWYRFTALLEPGKPGREYQRPVGGGDIIASAPGPVLGILSIGGPRRAGFSDPPPAFAYHVLAPADDIGAVGFEGTAPAAPAPGFQRIAHATRDSALADTLLGWRAEAMRGLPLFMVRAETDSSVTLADLGQGQAYANLLIAMDNLCAAAASLGRRARLLAVGIDHSLEDIRSSPAQIAAGLRLLMARIERDAAARGLQRPVFLATFESGTTRISDHPAIRAHWELAWSHGAHQLAFSAPGYMFGQEAFGRPTDDARLRMAEMDAHAVVALSGREDWTCPLFLLAEAQGREIRVTARSMSDLVIDRGDPFGAGPACGFSLSGSKAAILSVALDADDAKALILTCDGAVGNGAELRYAVGAAPRAGPFPANRGSIRDQWAAPSRAGDRVLHRWAYPSALPVRLASGAGASRKAIAGKPVAVAEGVSPAPLWLHANVGAFVAADGDPGRATGWRASDGRVAGSVASNRRGTEITPAALRYEAETNSGLVLEAALPNLGDCSFGLVFQAGEGGARTLLSLQVPGQAGYLFLDMQGEVVRLAQKGGDLLLEAVVGMVPEGPMLVLCAISGGMAKLSINGADPVLAAIDVPDLAAPADLFIGCRGARTGLRNKLGAFLLSDVFAWPDGDCLALANDPDATQALAVWRERQRDGI